jgi:hydroxyacylglutathione hydrolase
MTPQSDAPLTITALPAFESNYLWLIHNTHTAWVVDPGDGAVVQAALQYRKLTLSGILITHHHADHTGGIAALRAAHPHARVIGPVGRGSAPISGVTHAAVPNASHELVGLNVQVDCIAVPGHTLDHLAYYLAPCEWVSHTPRLFCGDTLFAAGCGRVFEGTSAQMHASLTRLTALPSITLAYCAHEYTVGNLQFAAAVEPGNTDISARLAQAQALRASGQATVPFELGKELTTNPFLRCHTMTVKAIASNRTMKPLDDEVAVFAEIRAWKNIF